MADTPKRRGRPRAYDPDTALRAAMTAFWDAGYSGTSLDDIGNATGMNRPSLYAAFGDKEELYLKSLRQYFEASSSGLRDALHGAPTLRDALATTYRGALSLFLSGDNGPRGCLLIGTAATEAVKNPRVREALCQSLAAFDLEFERRFELAKEQGELPANADVLGLARVAAAIMQTLAVRARAGEPRQALEAVAAAGVDAICGPAAGAAPQPRAAKKPGKRRSPRA